MKTYAVASESVRPSEALFVQTLTVEDDELHPIGWAHMLPTERSSHIPRPSQMPRASQLPRASRPDLDVTLTVTDEELHSIVFAHQPGAYWHSSWRAALPENQSRAEPASNGALLGRVIGDKYKLHAVLGTGGMGVVYEAEHVPSGNLVAVKVLPRHAGHLEVAERFRREARATSQLTHPNTVQVFEFGETDELLYFVMEYLEGRDLGRLIRQDGRVPYGRAVAYALDVCASVGQAHELGIIHRDIKPENLFVLEGKPGRRGVKVLDFGIAQVREDEADGSGIRSVMGTPHYMAPEQIRGEALSPRSDVYALAATLYKAITGYAPFAADTPMKVLEKHLGEELVPMRERVKGLAVPRELDAVIARAMRKDPAQRHASMREFAEALARATKGPAEPRTRAGKKSKKKQRRATSRGLQPFT